MIPFWYFKKYEIIELRVERDGVVRVDYEHGLYSNGTYDLLSRQKIQCFFKKIFNSYVYVSVDNDTVKILKEI